MNIDLDFITDSREEFGYYMESAGLFYGLEAEVLAWPGPNGIPFIRFSAEPNDLWDFLFFEYCQEDEQMTDILFEEAKRDSV